MPVLVVGNFPPLPGPVTAATLQQVRDRLAAGVHVRTASPRPSGAEMVVAAAGRRAGRQLAEARRRTGADEVVFAIDDGVPARAPRGGRRRPLDLAAAIVGVLSLARALRQFRTVTVLIAADPGVPPVLWRLLWPVATRVVVAGSGLERALGVPARLVDAAPPPPPLRGMVAGGGTALGPPEVAPWTMPRYVAGRVARALLGPAFAPTWAAVRWAGRPVVRRIRRLRAR